MIYTFEQKNFSKICDRKRKMLLKCSIWIKFFKICLEGRYDHKKSEYYNFVCFKLFLRKTHKLELKNFFFNLEVHESSSGHIQNLQFSWNFYEKIFDCTKTSKKNLSVLLFLFSRILSQKIAILCKKVKNFKISHETTSGHIQNLQFSSKKFKNFCGCPFAHIWKSSVSFFYLKCTCSSISRFEKL